MMAEETLLHTGSDLSNTVSPSQSHDLGLLEVQELAYP